MPYSHCNLKLELELEAVYTMPVLYTTGIIWKVGRCHITWYITPPLINTLPCVI